MVTEVAMRKVKTLAGMRIAGSLVVIMLVLPNVAQADEQQAMPRVVGWSVTLDVPGLGEVSVPEKGYQEIQDLLKSDDAADHEKAFALLQRSAEEESAPLDTGPSEFRIVHPPATTSRLAPDDNVRDPAEPLSFDHPPPRRRARGLR
jgi:hypothetical protein